MPEIVRMPKLGVNMEKGRIMEWVVKEGDFINSGDPIMNIETDKAVQEFCSLKSGVLAKILVPEGDMVQIQTPIAVLVKPGEELSEEFLANFKEDK